MATVTSPITGSLSHLQDDPLYQTEAPYEIWLEEWANDVPRTNVKLELVHDFSLTDVRTLDASEKPCLDRNGVEWVQHHLPSDTGIHSADDVGSETIERRAAIAQYVDCVSRMLHEQFGCIKTICYDWRVRRSKLTLPFTSPNIYSLKDRVGDDARGIKINASHTIHADGSPAWMQRTVSSVITPEEEAWTRKNNHRIRVITVWRPLVDVVETDPLLLCDTASVAEEDWDVVQKVREVVEESMYLKRRDAHRWLWMRDQTREDVIVMAVWDSRHPYTRRTAAPHCALAMTNRPEGAKPRESIELRCIVWSEN